MVRILKFQTMFSSLFTPGPFVCEGGTLSHRPGDALVFSDESQAREWAQTYLTDPKLVVPVGMHSAWEEFEQWIELGYPCGQLGMKNLEMSRKYNDESPEEVLKWHVWNQRYGDQHVAYEDYETWPDLHGVFDHLFGVRGFYSDDYSSIAVTASICASRDSNFEDFKRELDVALPYVDYIDEETGAKIIDIFDHYLSEFGNSVNLLVHKNGQWEVVGSEEHGPSDPEDVFNFIRAYRYYE